MSSDFESTNKFSQYFKKFLLLVTKQMNHEGCNKILESYDNLDMDKTIMYFYDNLSNFESNIKTQNDTMFDSQIYIFPTVDISLIYNNLKNDSKTVAKFWNYVNFLFTISHLYSSLKLKKSNTEGFNPFVGVKGEGFGLKTLKNVKIDNVKNIDEFKPAEGGFNDLVGMGQMELLTTLMNPKMLLSKLKGIDKNELHKGLNDMKLHIADLKKETNNNKIINMIEKMFDNLSETLMNENLDEVDLFDTIKKASSHMDFDGETIGDADMKDLMKMATDVAGKMSSIGDIDDPMMKQVQSMLPLVKQMMENMNNDKK